MKQRVEEMEREANKLREMQAAAEKAERENEQGGAEGVPMDTEEDKAMADSRSIYIGNVRIHLCPLWWLIRFACVDPLFTFQVDYSATPEEIQGHFQACGTINRVTILCDKFTGHPKGYGSMFNCETSVWFADGVSSRYAYVEFAEPEHVDAALAMNDSLFRGRLIKVCVLRGGVLERSC